MENKNITKALAVLCGILLFFLLFFARKNDETENKLREIKAKEEQYIKDIDSLKKEKETIKKEKDSISKAIGTTKTVINNIKTEKEVRIKYVEKMGNKELQNYFNERYKDGK